MLITVSISIVIIAINHKELFLGWKGRSRTIKNIQRCSKATDSNWDTLSKVGESKLCINVMSRIKNTNTLNRLAGSGYGTESPKCNAGFLSGAFLPMVGSLDRGHERNRHFPRLHARISFREPVRKITVPT